MNIIKYKNKMIKLLIAAFFTQLFYTQLFATDHTTTIYTPNGKAVTAWELDEYTPYYIEVYNAWTDSFIVANELDAERIGDSSRKYNCHAYAWYDNTVWINTPGDDDFWSDGAYDPTPGSVPSYGEVSEQYATHISYVGDDHSARQTSYNSQNPSNSTYISKWGGCGLVQHKKGQDCYEETGYNYYHANTYSGTISSSDTWFSGYLKGNTSINSGITVSIYEDATIYLNGYDLTVSGTLNIDKNVTIKVSDDDQINIYGTLDIDGEDEDEVTITTVNPPGQRGAGDWVGIVMQGGYLDAEYCKIKYAVNGIQASSAAEIEMDYSEITSCNMGLYLTHSEAYLYRCKIQCSSDAFYLYNYSTLGLLDNSTKGYNKIYYDIELDYHSMGDWGEYYPSFSGFNAFYEGYGHGELLLDNYSYVLAENNYWDEDRTFEVYGGSTLDYNPDLMSDPTKVPAKDIAEWEIEQLFLEARRTSLKNPDKTWDMFKDIIENYSDSKFAKYSLSRMKIISKKIEDNDFVSYLENIINNKPELKEMALEISINQLIEKGMIHEALTNCFYLLANYPDNKIKNYVLYQMFIIYLDYLGDTSNAERVLADLKEIDANSEGKVLQFALNILDNYNNSKLDRKIGDITFSYPNYPADIEGYKETESEKITAGIPKTFALHQNYPNPFNPVTTIKYDLPEATDVKITVYNVLGQEVATIINDNLNAGSHETKWDASRFASGIYICRLEAGNYTRSIKLLLLK